MFTDKTQLTQIADENFTFSMPVVFTSEKQADGTRKLRLKLYDGSVVNHPWWGNLAFDLNGFRLAKKRIGILYDHDTSQRIGVADSYSTEGGFEITGFAIDNENSQNILKDMDQGFPFEASLRMSRDSKFRFIREGETVEVNGKQLKGPGTVFTTTVVNEGSVCVFGALNNCKTDAFNQNSLSERTKIMDLKQLQTEHPDLYNQVFALGKAEGARGEQDRFAKIKDACGNDTGLTCEAFSQGKTEMEALKLCNQKLSTQLTQMSASMAQGQAAANPEKQTATQPVGPAASEFSDDVKASQTVALTASAHPANAGKDLFSMTDEELKTKFSGDAQLQGQYGGDVNAFLAFIKAKKDGLIR